MPKVNPGEWQASTVDIDRGTQFSGDDVDQYSGLVDLGDEYSYVQVYCPTMTSTVVGLCLQRSSSSAEVPYPLNSLSEAATGDYLLASTAGTTDRFLVFFTGAVRYLRVKCGSNQAADRTFYVRGC